MPEEKSFNLADLLDIVVDTVPAEREALVCGARRLSYREFRDNAQRLALWLRSRGIGTDDTVGIQAANSIEFLEATFAAYMLRAVPVNVNYRYTADEARYIYTNAELRALFYDCALEDAVSGALDGAPGLRALVRIGSGAPSLPTAVAYATAARWHWHRVRSTRPPSRPDRHTRCPGAATTICCCSTPAAPPGCRRA